MHPTEIPYLTLEQYDSLSPANRGWFSRVQGSNPNIPTFARTSITPCWQQSGGVVGKRPTTI